MGAPLLQGLAFVASANFMSRIVTFLNNFINSLMTPEMVLIYGARLKSHVILFFQAIFMIPVFLLGFLVFIGLIKRSFGLVLYPTLMLMFLVLLRYGGEISLLIIHWEDHSSDVPPLALFLILDILSIVILLIYVYVSLSGSPSSSDGGDKHHSVSGDEVEAPHINNLMQSPKRKQPAIPPSELEAGGNIIPPSRPPPSPKFNYKLRRNIGNLPQGSPERAMVEELDKQRQRNSQILLTSDSPELESPDPESPGPSRKTNALFVKTQSLKIYETEPKRRSLVIETDLDALDVVSTSPIPSPKPKTPSPTPTPAPEDTPSGVKDKGEGEEEEEDGEWEWEYEYEDEEPESDANANAKTATSPDEIPRTTTPPQETGDKTYKTTAV